jgi:hypothetical protein
VACQANLRHWGLIFNMYTNEHGTFQPGFSSWWTWAPAYYGDSKRLLLCPMASRYKVNKSDPSWQVNMTLGYGVGSKFSAWRTVDDYTMPVSRATPVYGSYGVNLHLTYTYSSVLSQPLRGEVARHTLTQMPVLLDCATTTGDMTPSMEPPAYDGDLTSESVARYFCIDRHNQAINGLFLDWSSCRVGLKELWTLKWNRQYKTAGPWTKAGGVLPDDWPRWMRGFRDY